MELVVSGVKLTSEDVLKAVWKKILVWFWDLQFQNALANDDPQLDLFRRIKEIESG